MREVLEETAARLAAQHATAVKIGVLERIVENDRSLVDQPRRLTQTNRRFYQQMRDTARYPLTTLYAPVSLKLIRLVASLVRHQRSIPPH